MTQFHHIPIMLKEVLELLAPERGGIFVDGTLGGGGHRTMAACQMQSDSFEDAIMKLRNAIDEYKKELKK